MAYTTIDDPTIYFNTLLYTGNATARSITGVGFAPNWVWIKDRSVGASEGSHALLDTVRGATKVLISNNSDSEFTGTTTLTSFDSDGFSLGTNVQVNTNTSNIVSWNWKAGTSFTNDASSTGIGTIDSTGSVSTDAGFAIISYNGTGSNGSIKHGLSTAPRMMIFKNRDEGAEGWFVYHESVGNTKRAGLLDETSVPSTSSTFFQATSPTSSIITLGSNHGCNGPDAMICYAFAEKKGYSKFGSYQGNSSTDGTFVYLGFKPAFVIIKNASDGNNWVLLDNKRNTFNVQNTALAPNTSGADDTNTSNYGTDFLSNGMKMKTSGSYTSNSNNASGDTYIYMAFAESPFVNSNGVPNNAR